MKKLEDLIAIWLKPYRNFIKWISIIINAFTIIVLILWIFKNHFAILNPTFEHEPILIGLTMLFAALNQIHRWLLKEAEYSPAYSLAIGYVTNFVSPLITQLLENGISNPKVYIYKPKDFAELFKENIDRIKAQVQNQGFHLSEVNLDLKHSRARDILTIKKSKTKIVYFDFPNTLLSLIAYVDYKVNSKKDSFADKKRLTEDLIEKFYQKVDELLESENIQEHVLFCDKEMNLEF